MPNIGLLLRSPLIKDVFSALLTDAGFSILREPGLPDDDATLIIDFDDWLDLEGIRAHQWRGAKIVVLASEADSLTMSDDQIAPLSGVLTCDLSAAAFVRSLRLICSGERVFARDPTSGRSRPAQSTEIEPPGRLERLLSARERQVLLLVVEGCANKVIAGRLGTAETTVKIHLKNVFRKINVANRTEAAIWALANLSEGGNTARGFV
jgi:two-component system nitrate/nitrite response regulator NarL